MVPCADHGYWLGSEFRDQRLELAFRAGEPSAFRRTLAALDKVIRHRSARAQCADPDHAVRFHLGGAAWCIADRRDGLCRDLGVRGFLVRNNVDVASDAQGAVGQDVATSTFISAIPLPPYFIALGLYSLPWRDPFVPRWFVGQARDLRAHLLCGVGIRIFVRQVYAVFPAYARSGTSTPEIEREILAGIKGATWVNRGCGYWLSSRLSRRGQTVLACGGRA